ncbi:MAG: D-alanyl-D-alanine carboxypeptidase [Bacteroidota bacterium]
MKAKLIVSIHTLLLLLSFSLDAQKKKDAKQLEAIFESSTVFQDIFTGFALYDPTEQAWLYQRAADKYYTPASNTKLFTLYTALKILGDSIPSLFYQENDTAFIFWGTGNPALLYDLLPADSSVLTFLKQQDKPLYFSDHNFQEKRFGPGWSWDDVSYAYQSERTPMPIYGNIVRFLHQKDSLGFQTIPSYFKDKVQLDQSMDNRRPRFRRAIDDNQFYCNAHALAGNRYERAVPFRSSNALFRQLLSDTLQRIVRDYEQDLQAFELQTFYGRVPADSIYQLMMQASDNFVAEQLLLTASNQIFGTQNTEQIIDYIKTYYLKDLPDEAIWVDGSGLSRYNLFTPRSIIVLLEKLYQMLPEVRLLNLFPAGGVSGTIERWYAAEQGQAPYVFAKTGTLSNKHCLSGFLKTKSGKTLIFSFMNNNYIGSSRPVKQEMEKVLQFVRDSY